MNAIRPNHAFRKAIQMSYYNELFGGIGSRLIVLYAPVFDDKGNVAGWNMLEPFRYGNLGTTNSHVSLVFLFFGSPAESVLGRLLKEVIRRQS
jgi:hypothetical protein